MVYSRHKAPIVHVPVMLLPKVSHFKIIRRKNYPKKHFLLTDIINNEEAIFLNVDILASWKQNAPRYRAEAKENSMYELIHSREKN